ncbi:MAG: DnaJ domain-containing protein [Clostridia bacterium]|nr:DnaJ domain-containing protein [Clostridia bacterium]
MQEYYKILGLTENATDVEVDNAYKTLKDKYSRDRFLEGDAGNEAAKKLTKIEEAYNEIKSARLFSSNSNDNTDFSQVEECLKKGEVNKAQDLLDSIANRNAEWHYLQSVVFYKKNWYNECKKQLEIAVDLDKSNSKYRDALNKLNERLAFNEQQFRSGNANYSGAHADNNQAQMGGNGCANFIDCCTTWCCINMLCNGCCR